jgi:branched-chain amino acid transport system substrate-binding protein
MKMKKILVPLLAFALLFGISSMALAKTIKVGGLKDTTGATSDVGKDAALGQAEFWSHYVNDNGGINGKPVKYIWFDYGYRIPEAITKYDSLCLRLLFRPSNQSQKDSIQRLLFIGLFYQRQVRSDSLV